MQAPARTPLYLQAGQQASRAAPNQVSVALHATSQAVRRYAVVQVGRWRLGMVGLHANHLSCWQQLSYCESCQNSLSVIKGVSCLYDSSGRASPNSGGFLTRALEGSKKWIHDKALQSRPKKYWSPELGVLFFGILPGLWIPVCELHGVWPGAAAAGHPCLRAGWSKVH